MSRAERTLARFQWIDSNNHFEDYTDDDHFQLNRLVPSLDMVVAIGIVVFFVGGYAGFIALLAVTR